jgi:hypothetical protein
MNLPSFSFVFSGRPVKFCFHTTLLAEVATPLHRLIVETMDDSERNLKKKENFTRSLRTSSDSYQKGKKNRLGGGEIEYYQ